MSFLKNLSESFKKHWAEAAAIFGAFLLITVYFAENPPKFLAPDAAAQHEAAPPPPAAVQFPGEDAELWQNLNEEKVQELFRLWDEVGYGYLQFRNEKNQHPAAVPRTGREKTRKY